MNRSGLSTGNRQQKFKFENLTSSDEEDAKSELE